MTAKGILAWTLSKSYFETWRCSKCGQQYSDFPGVVYARVCGYCDADVREALAVLNPSSDFVTPDDDEVAQMQTEDSQEKQRCQYGE